MEKTSFFEAESTGWQSEQLATQAAKVRFMAHQADTAAELVDQRSELTPRLKARINLEHRSQSGLQCDLSGFQSASVWTRDQPISSKTT